MPGRLIRGTAADFTGAPLGGTMLRFHEPVRTGSVYLTVAMPYDSSTMTIDDDLVDDLHLSHSLLDVLELGTQRRLMLNSEYARSARQPQDEARRSEETPVGALVPSNQFLVSLYIRRRQEEVNRLRRLYPIRIS
jgi:hypothetical protein